MEKTITISFIQEGRLIKASLIFLISFFLTTSQSFSQNFPHFFLKQYGGEGGDFYKVILETEDGYLLGAQSTSVPSKNRTAPAYGNTDYWIVKTDKKGKKLWDKSYGGEGEDNLSKVIKTSDGGFLLVGSSMSAPSGNKTSPLKSENSYMSDFWVVKISSTGDIQWQKSYGGLLDDVLNDAIEDSNGNFILVGSSMSLKNEDKSEDPYGAPFYGIYYKTDVWVIKIDKNGNKIWDKIYGGTNDDYHGYDSGLRIIKTRDGNYLVGASSDSRAGNDKTQDNFCTDCSTASNGPDIWVIKITPSGTKIWDQIYGGFSSEFVEFLAVNPNGGYILAGPSYSGIGGNKTTEVPESFSHIWIISINENGQKIKENTSFEESEPSFFSLDGFAVDTHGYYIATTASTMQGTISIRLVNYDWSGNLVNQWNYAGSEYIRGGALTINNRDILYGYSKNVDESGGIDPDLFLVKFPKVLLSASTQSDAIESTVAYSNPVKEDLFVSVPKELEEVSLSIKDSEGKIYYYGANISCKKEQPIQIKLPINSMKTGIYYLSIESKGKRKVIELIKQ
jgi:hypothetical protein